MKISLDVVHFDTDVRGPGPRHEATPTATWAVKQPKYKGSLALEYDVELASIRMMKLEDDGGRPEVLVPYSRVVHMEPSPKTAPAKKVA